MDQVAVEKAYVAELEALEKFRVLYTGLHPNAPLGREDPDVRRLIEALAFFSARTRVAAERTVNESLLRIFRQHFPYVLSPMPAMVMLQGETSASHVDTVALPRGVEVLVQRRPARGQLASPRRYSFRTTAPLRLVPITLDAVEVGPGTKGRRLLLRFSSRFPRTDAVGRLSLYVNHLNDLFASMAMLLSFKQHLRKASVIYGKVEADSVGAECGVSFGAPEGGPDEMAAFEHPEQRFRAALHFPQAEQYLHLDVPPMKGSWQQFAVCLDVGEGWPAEYGLNVDTFALNAVPMINIKQDMADPIECDGTKERYAVRHPDIDQGFVPHSILGVYHMSKQGMIPMEPGVLGPTKQGYETVFEGQDEGRRAWALLDLPSAFYQPENVAVEAFWMQPDLTGAQASELEAQLSTRHVEGIRWSCAGVLVPHATNEMEDDRDSLLGMASLKSLRFLGLAELSFLVRALGSMRRPEFNRITMALNEVKLETRPAGRKAGGVSNIYGLRFGDLTSEHLPWLDLFCRKLLGLLEAWSAEQVVEIIATIPRLDRVLRYPGLKAAMRSVSALWFHIETAFTEVQDLCVIARAAQLALEATKAAPPLRAKSTLMSGALPPGLLDQFDPDAPRDPLLARATELARDGAFRAQYPDGANIVEMRERIRARMVWLRGKFDEVFRSHESSQALFPIVVYVDELVKVSTSGASNRWEPLQSLLYKVDNGGELFFSILEERLEQQETNPLVLEIFYYCLAAGFTGAYQRDKQKLESYQTRLALRFLPPKEDDGDPVEAPLDVKIVTFPYEFYAIGVGVVLVVYLTLTWLAAPG